MMKIFRFWVWVFSGTESLADSVAETASFMAESGSTAGMGGGGFWEVDLEIFFLLGTQPPPLPIIV